MPEELEFPREYQPKGESEVAEQAESAVTPEDSIKATIEQEVRAYGLAKPRRVVTRARIVHD